VGVLGQTNPRTQEQHIPTRAFARQRLVDSEELTVDHTLPYPDYCGFKISVHFSFLR